MFSIDSVRGTIDDDVKQLLERIELAAAGLAASQPAPPTGGSKNGKNPAFQIIEEAGHAIYGTSALVAADSLASCARVIEQMAERAQLDVRVAAWHSERARKLTELVRAGAGEMRNMLRLELDHCSDEAQWLALDWRQRATELLDAALDVEPLSNEHPVTETSEEAPSSTPVAEASSAEEEFDFTGDGTEIAIEELDADSLVEVLEVADASAIQDVRAVVDTRLVGKVANGEAVALSGEAEEGSAEEEFAFESVGDDALASTPVNAIHGELLEIFQDEVRENLAALQTNVRALFADAADLPAARALERIYHTLKGAAATVGLEAVSHVASGLQDRMEAVVDDGEPVTPALLEQLVAETVGLLDMVGLPGITLGDQQDADAHTTSVPREGASATSTVTPDGAESPAGVLSHGDAPSAVAADGAAQSSAEVEEEELSFRFSVPPPAQEDETTVEFARELRQALHDAGHLVGVLEGASMGASTNGATAAEALADLGELFHRLKGSALIVGEQAIAQEAAALRRACDGETEGDTSTVQLLKDGLGRIAAMAGIDDEVADANAAPPSSGGHHPIAVPDPELWHAFNLECVELLEAIDARVLELESSDSPRREIDAVLPSYHTLKGVLNTLGMTPTGTVIHRVEDFLEGLLKATVLPPMRIVTTFLLQVQVEVRRNLKQAPKGSVEVALPRVEAHLARVLSGRGIAIGGHGATSAKPGINGASEGSRGETGTSARSADDGAALARNFVRVGTDRLDQLMDLAGELVVSRSRLMSRVQGLRAVQKELGRGGRRLIETVHQFCEEHEFARIDGRVAASRAPAVLALAAGAEHMSAAAGPALVASSSSSAAAGGSTSWGGFSDLELDRYEDVQVLARSLAELTSDFEGIYAELSSGLGVLSEDSDAFGSIVSGIQSEITRARMVPMEVLFTRLRLAIRDAAMREGKEVRITTHGESVRLDKTIADALFQPMLHLVRNAVAHGFEKTRDATGKQRTNTIELRVREELGQVVIEVRDDGAGLNLERLRAQGIAMGLIGSDVSIHDPVVKDLVFASGLSTTKSARDVAGRGLGCDIVKRAVERMSGSVHVETEPGKGTCFFLTLPLTLAITKALLVRQGERSFAVPLYFAERIFDVAEQEIVDSAGVRRIRLDGAFHPLYSLGHFLGRPSPANAKAGAIVVIRSGGERIMLQVDAIVGQEEIVVKSLGAILTGHPLFAGVTIRGSGEMVLILDIPGLVEARQAEHVQGRRQAPAALVRPATVVRPEVDTPPAKRSEPPRPRVLASEERRADEARTRLRVIFVDDSLAVRKVAEKTLQGLGVDVTLAVDGVDALAKMREGGFDLVFTDLEMPRMHGFELIRELRFRAVYQDLPIVVVTSRSGQKHQDEARALGATEYLTKPFTARTLEAALNKWGRRTRFDA